jgi:hypothetical protein
MVPSRNIPEISRAMPTKARELSLKNESKISPHRHDAKKIIRIRVPIQIDLF